MTQIFFGWLKAEANLWLADREMFLFSSHSLILSLSLSLSLSLTLSSLSLSLSLLSLLASQKKREAAKSLLRAQFLRQTLHFSFSLSSSYEEERGNTHS